MSRTRKRVSLLPYLPTLEEWRQSYREIRELLSAVYKEPETQFRSDSEFCTVKRLPRAQFSRVMSGNEQPSPRIVEAVFCVLGAEVYLRHARSWVGQRSFGNSDEFAKAFGFLIGMPSTLDY
jgi:hypothetical protein